MRMAHVYFVFASALGWLGVYMVGAVDGWAWYALTPPIAYVVAALALLLWPWRSP